jgi:nucleoporin POM34
MSSSAVSTIATKASNTTARMVSTPTKSTPTKLAPALTVTDSPGNWKHPRLAEISRRQRKNEFGQRNINSIAYNAGALILSIVLRQVATSKLPTSW